MSYTFAGDIRHRIFPEWNVDSEFISHHLNRALDLDAKSSSHPIEVDCPDANHINQVILTTYTISCPDGSYCEDLRRLVLLQSCVR